MSSPLLTPEEFLQQAANWPIFDVRSPAEYRQGHIPGAWNLPLLSDEERREIGLLYKQSGKEAAVMRGLQIVGPRLTDYIVRVKNSTGANRLLLHCWRGGMRSESLAWLLEKAGFQVALLKGGYKAFRKQVLADFDRSRRLLVLGGMTGSGKTEILHLLRECGEQVLDLEQLARHRGSAFGSLEGFDQPSTEQFENDTWADLRSFAADRPIWVEDESRGIGRVLINESLFCQMRSAPLVRIHVPREIRVERLCRDYGQVPKDKLAAAVAGIHKRLGGENAGLVLAAIDQGNYAVAVRTVLDYYDKAYLHGNTKRNPATVVDLNPTPEGPEDIARALVALAGDSGLMADS
jgi:tRNA 2-selenouridine synthase